MANPPPAKIIVTGARAPVALHIARLLSSSDTQIILADTFSSPISARSRSCHRFLELPPPRFQPDAYREALTAAIEREDAKAVVPTCEEVFYLAQIRQDLPAPVIAPPADMLATVHNKFAFVEYAGQLGLNVPDTRLLRSKADVQQASPQSRHLVFKPVWSRFASDVLLRPGPKGLRDLAPTPQAPWIAQDHLEGTELSVYAVARQGRLVALSAYASLYRAGKGAGVCFQPVREPLVRDWVETFVGASEWDGQVSFDMMLCPDRRLFALECNPRATSGLHFFQDPRAFSQAFRGGVEAQPDTTGMLGSRFAMWVYGFPQAVLTGKVGGFFATLRRTRDILDWPGDPAPRRAQIATLARIARIALRDRISLRRAATHDIEWNGPDQDRHQSSI